MHGRLLIVFQEIKRLLWSFLTYVIDKQNRGCTHEASIHSFSHRGSTHQASMRSFNHVRWADTRVYL